MNVDFYRSLLEKPQKSYEKINMVDSLVDRRDLYFMTESGYKIPLSEKILERVTKYAGVPKAVLKYLEYEDWRNLIISKYADLQAYVKLPKEPVDVLIDDLFVGDVVPMMNEDFINAVISFFEDRKEFSIKEILYDKVSTESSVLVELTNNQTTTFNPDNYVLGVVFLNDESWQITCRLSVRVGEDVYYLPSQHMNLTSGRYNRTSSDIRESLGQLMLRVSDDMLTPEWYDKIESFVVRMRDLHSVSATYEEYSNVRTTLKRAAVSSDMEEEVKDIDDILYEEMNDFERNYKPADSREGSYLWRCTAISDNTIAKLVESVNSILSKYRFYDTNLKVIRMMLGDLVMTRRIIRELAPRRD